MTEPLAQPARSSAQPTWRPIALVGLIAALVLVVDQISKTLVVATLGPSAGGRTLELIPGVLWLLYVENTGAAFGLFQGRNPVLAAVALVIVLLLAIWFRALAAATPWGALALGLQIGGALGNVVDRLRHGFVIDFIDVPFWPTFNLADSAITIGVAILLVVLVRSDAQRASQAEQQDGRR
ncbi:signal peptidase II [Thermalbibacter longus]|uniref:signal peptidase II n=1 Tax=Thermalbibacter longus TaxID=2951981 RepID=UPI0024C32EDE|nr:signal peptidase II [Thermalbibacter longus]